MKRDTLYTHRHSVETLVAVCKAYMNVASQPEPHPRHVSRVVFGLLPPDARRAIKSVKEMQRVLHGLASSSLRMSKGGEAGRVPDEVRKFLPLPVMHPRMARKGIRRPAKPLWSPAQAEAANLGLFELIVEDRNGRSEINLVCSVADKSRFLQAIASVLNRQV